MMRDMLPRLAGHAFIVRDGKLISPPNDNSLESITQATVIEIAKNMGIEVVRRRITREEIYIADEAFLTERLPG